MKSEESPPTARMILHKKRERENKTAKGTGIDVNYTRLPTSYFIITYYYAVDISAARDDGSTSTYIIYLYVHKQQYGFGILEMCIQVRIKSDTQITHVYVHYCVMHLCGCAMCKYNQTSLAYTPAADVSINASS